MTNTLNAPLSEWEYRKAFWRGQAEGALIKWVMKYKPFEAEKEENNG